MIALLERALSRPSHAYLLVGPDDEAMLEAAKAWVNALFCRQTCGRCEECRSLQHGNHPDFHVWEPQGKRNTTIDQVREIVRQADLAPFRAAYQVHVLRADTLNAASANALLKTLEEPPPGTILMLLATSLSDLLPTLVSRCQRISLSPLPAREAEVAPPTPLLAIADLSEALVEAERLAGLPSAEQLQVLEDLISQLRDVRIALATGDPASAQRPGIAAGHLAAGRSPAYWASVMERLERTRFHLEAAGNSKLAWGHLAGELVGLRHQAALRAG